MTHHENGRRRSDSEEVALLDLAAVIIRRWKTLFVAVLATVALAAAALVVLPERYRARTVVVPAIDKSAGRGMMMLADQLPVGLSGLVGAGESSDRKMIEAVLKSRTLADSVVARLGFVPHSRTKGENEIRRILQKRTTIASNPDGSFSIDVRDVDPERAARIANHVPELSNIILSDLVGQTAVRKQAFLENQVANAQQELELTERQLVAFQTTRDAPEIQEQARRTIEAAALLQQQIFEHEVRVTQLRRTATPENPQLRAAVSELEALRGQLNRITSGQGRDNQVFLSLRESPELRADATRILREYAKNEKIYVSLTAALTEAQLEARNTLPVVTVLDPAIVPQEPSGMRTAIALPIALLLGLVFGLVAIFSSEYMRSARSDPQNEQFFVAWSRLKGDLAAYSPRRRQRETHGVTK